jgi:hypothetical protein
VVARRSQTWVGHLRAISGQPMLIHALQATLCRGLENSLSERHGHGMACVNQTWLYRVNQMGKTQSRPLEAWHGRGKTWAWHGNGMVCVNYPLLGMKK